MISEVLRKRRLEINKKISQIAMEIGVSTSTYRDWENGRKIQGEPYKAIAEALEMNILDLLEIHSPSRNYLHQQLDTIEKCLKKIKQFVK